MSPLGWVWVVIFVVMGYCLILMFCYSMMVTGGFFKISVGMVSYCDWVW